MKSRYKNLSSGTNSQEEHRKYKELCKAEQHYNKWHGKDELNKMIEKQTEYFKIIKENIKNYE